MCVSRLWPILTVVVLTASAAVAEDTLVESEAIAKIKQLGGQIIDGSPRGVTVNLEPVPFLVIPFWAIVIPLTLISAYLLLTRPDKTTTATISESVADEGT